ncbi:fatty-acid--CoA ligase [Gammaproteobacteria bacterium 42_54_T18]|nr:fatty-acid--CoA ligase [Gammaproteobacteria bacterium 42_54_T18]
MHLTQSLKRALQLNPQGVATISGERQHTWTEFYQRIRCAAAGLLALGLEKKDRVAILSLNSDRYFELVYALPWAGLISVPLNIRLAPAEIIFLLNDSGAKVLCVDETFSAMLSEFKGKLDTVETIVYMGDNEFDGAVSYEDLLSKSETIEDTGAGGDEVAGIFYTGGTTGLPKGVMLTHDNLVANGLNAVHGFGFTKHSRYLHAAPMFHAADAAANIGLTMLGGTHVFVPKFEPELVLDTFVKSEVTNVMLVPTMVNMLVNTHDIDTYDLSVLVRICYGGSPMPEAVLLKAKALIPHVEFTQAYGMTELSPIITILDDEYHVTDGPKAGKIRSAGQVVLSGEIRVVNENDEELPRGQIGEVVARGPTVMKGYWNREVETAQALANGWMHTGDAGYMDEDGFVFIADRVKDMIISGGENVYSVEVENAVQKHPAVSACAVIGIPNDEWGEEVLAIVVPNEGESATDAHIISFCKEHIAGYKCPRGVVFVDALPTSGAGKILKNKLRDPYWEGRERNVN